MNFIKKNFIACVLVLSVTFYLGAAPKAHAQGVIDAITSIESSVVNAFVDVVQAVVSIANVIPNLAIGVSESFVGAITGISFFGDDGNCRLSNLTGGPYEIYSGRCDKSGVSFAMVVPSDGTCGNKIETTFYIPQMNVMDKSVYSYNQSFDCSDTGDGEVCSYRKVYLDDNTTRYYSDSDNYSCTTPDPNGDMAMIDSDSSGNQICGNVGKEVVPSSLDETDRQIAIYRFTLPANSTQAELSAWYVNSIKISVGSGWLSPAEYYQADSRWTEAAPYQTIPYSEMCSDNVCRFIDAAGPDNSYVAYVAKVLGSYSYQGPEICDSEGNCSPSTELVTSPNKFLNTDNVAATVFPSSTVGNAIYARRTGVAADNPACTTPKCGSATASITVPTDNLCSSGTASAVFGDGPWSWTCAGNASANPPKSETFVLGPNFTMNASLDKSSYMPGETITANASWIHYVSQDSWCSGGSMDWKIDDGFYTHIDGSSNIGCWDSGSPNGGLGTFSAPTTAGSHTATFLLSYQQYTSDWSPNTNLWDNYTTATKSISFTVSPIQEAPTATCSAGVGANGDSVCANGASDYPTCVCGTASGKTYPFGSTSYVPDTQCLTGTSDNTNFPSAGVSPYGAAWLCHDPNTQQVLSGMCWANQAAATSCTPTYAPGSYSCSLTANNSACKDPANCGKQVVTQTATCGATVDNSCFDGGTMPTPADCVGKNGITSCASVTTTCDNSACNFNAGTWKEVAP